MSTNATVRKTSRIAAMAAVLGATAAVVLVGVPAEAATSGENDTRGRGVVITQGRGV